MTCIMILTMMVVAPYGTQALSCAEVLKMVMPCLNYLKKGGSIPATCCAGVRNLASSARTKPDRQQACRCIKPAAKSYGINYDYANKLPAACGVDYKIHITPSTDCSKYIFLIFSTTFLVTLIWIVQNSYNYLCNHITSSDYVAR
ncbi:Non-specific lipid-transfer protein [Bienertia sinuspersici]